METKYKNYFGIAGVVALFVFAYAAVSYVNSYSKSIEPSSFRSFSVSGEGKAIAVPDVAEFTFSVITEGGTNLAALQKENTEKTNKAIAFLKANDIDKKDIKTANYGINPRYQNSDCGPVFYGGNLPKQCPPPEIVGYSINQTVSVKIRNFDKIGAVLSGIVQNGANSVSGLSFTVDDRAKLQDQARAEAITKAKARAELIAKAGGFGVGRLLGIEEGGIAPIFYERGLSVDGKGGATLPAPVIEPGSQEITVNVVLRYEIR